MSVYITIHEGDKVGGIRQFNAVNTIGGGRVEEKEGRGRNGEDTAEQRKTSISF